MSDAATVLSIGEVAIPFHEDEMTAILGNDGEIYVALRPIVTSLGIDWSAQRRRILRDPVLQKHLKTISVFIRPSVAVTTTQGADEGAAGQHRELLCLPKQYMAGFLFGINANRIKDDAIRERVVLYQEEAHLVLDAAFTGDEDSAIQALRIRYRKQGYDDAWIEKRVLTVHTRNELTEEWDKRGVEKRQYGILTAVIHRGVFNKTPSEHRTFKGIKRGNVRDHMDHVELALIHLGEAVTLQETRTNDAQGYRQVLDAAEEGGRIAGKARRLIEKETGQSAISDKSYLQQRKELQSGKPDSGSEDQEKP